MVLTTSKPTVYLAGPVQAKDDGGASWRETVKQQFSDGYKFRDPLDKYNVPVEDLTVVATETDDPNAVSVPEIVEGDKDLLQQSDAVLVGYDRVRSIGTPMEVMWAYERDYPIAVWIRDETPVIDMSPWYRYHADVLVPEAITALENLEVRL